MIRIVLALVTVVVALATQSRGDDVAEARAALREPRDGEQLKKAAVLLAQSGAKRDLEAVASRLCDTKALGVLDSDDDYVLNRHNLRVSQVVAALLAGHSESEGIFLRLADDAVFARHAERINALIQSAPSIKSPSSRVFDRLEKMAASSDGQTSGVLQACARIGSVDAAKLIDKIVRSPEPPVAIDFFPFRLMPYRNNAVIVGMLRRWLEDPKQSQAGRNAIVMALFDYDEDWFGGDRNKSKPPPRTGASPELLRELLEIASVAEKLELSSEAKASLAKGKREVGAILSLREKESKKGS